MSMPAPSLQHPWSRTDWEEFQATATDEQRALVAFPAEFLKLLGVIGRHPGGEPDKGLFGYTYRQHRYNPANPVHQAEIDLFPIFDPGGLFHFEDGTWCSEGYMLPTPKPEDLVGDISQAIAKGIVVWRPMLAAPVNHETAYSGEFPAADKAAEAADEPVPTSDAVAQLFENAREYSRHVRALQQIGVLSTTVEAVRDDIALKLGRDLLAIE